MIATYPINYAAFLGGLLNEQYTVRRARRPIYYINGARPFRDAGIDEKGRRFKQRHTALAL